MTTMTATERKAIAEKVGIDEQYLYQCFTGRKSMRAEEAARIDRDTDGAISRRQVRLHDWWLVWPELVTEEHPAPENLGQSADKVAS